MRFQTIPTLCCTLLLSSVPGLAQDIYFNPGDAVGSRATESGNWDNSTAAWWDGEDETETKVAWGSIADARKAAYFYGPNPGTASYTITLSEDVQAQSVRFNSGNYTLDGAGVLALNGGFTVLGNKTVVVKNDIYLNNIGYTSTQSRTFGGSNNGSLTLEGSLSLSPSTERTHSLTVNFQTGNASGVIALKGDNSGLVPVFTGIGGDRIVFGGAGHLDLHNDTVLGGMLLHLGNAAYKLRAVNGPLTFGNEFRPLGENGQIGIAGDHDITFTRSIAADETGNRNLVVHAHDAGVLTIGGYLSATPGGLRDANLIKSGVGTVVISGESTYDGTTNVQAGTLVVNGTHTHGAAYTVEAAGTLAGAGMIHSSVSVSGTIAPLESIAPLTLSSLTLQETARYTFSGVNSIAVSGALSLEQGWTLSLVGGVLADGGSITLFDFGTLASGASLTPHFDMDHLGFTPTGPLTLSNTGGAIVLHGVSYAAVPEPSTYLLLGVVGVGGVLWRRRRHAVS